MNALGAQENAEESQFLLNTDPSFSSILAEHELLKSKEKSLQVSIKVTPFWLRY
jgi:hypothetical protein